ncbi:helix-turn-helix domain-containing protein [Enterococcus sp. BWM-S5]|uniref:Helix-turn-helix domain-containing protein n=1 Tax=Enterococcus larvae TaxID=2794352 RepID=A0ABS4CFU5_9ENTE|nr:helix-turn-helix domain-containing protein [Enterococcus larvae]MBP1044812.1 helix-turn-helix domain-containing protein [Enterococcus larvae]
MGEYRVCTVSVVNINGELNERYVNELTRNQYNVDFTETEELLADIEDVDAVIIHFDEENEEVIWKICNLIFQIKESSKAFIWTFSNKMMEINRLVYLKLGIHGHIPAVCSPAEFELIIHNTVNHFEEKQIEEMIEVIENETRENQLTIYEHNRSLQFENGIEINLTKLEYRLLTILCSKKGKVFGYEELRNFVWQEEEVDSYRARLANLIFYLRKKVERRTGYSEFIRTIWARGYMLDLEIEKT